jgi:hypothetical protein
MARSGNRGSMPFSQLLTWLLRLRADTLVVCESAHLGVPQTELSLAQPFTADQLIKLEGDLRDRGVTLKLAPHAHTGKRMRIWVAHNYPNLMQNSEKSDEADAMTLAVFVDKCNDISLANPHKSFARSTRRDFGRKVTKLSTKMLNAERTVNYSGDFYPQVLGLARNVCRKAFYLGGLSDSSKLKFVVTIASTLFSETNGELVVLTHRGQPPGRWFWMREVLRMSPWHHRGGTARSNLMWHIFRPYLHNKAKLRGVNVKAGNKYKKFATYDARQKAAHTLSTQSFRRVLLSCRDSCIEQAQLIGAGKLELTEEQHEVSR